MNTPLSWIKAYVPDLDCTIQEYVDAMTLSGTKVEGLVIDKNVTFADLKGTLQQFAKEIFGEEYIILG